MSKAEIQIIQFRTRLVGVWTEKYKHLASFYYDKLSIAEVDNPFCFNLFSIAIQYGLKLLQNSTEDRETTLMKTYLVMYR